jgi:hypothetical protein
VVRPVRGHLQADIDEINPLILHCNTRFQRSMANRLMVNLIIQSGDSPILPNYDADAFELKHLGGRR